MDILVPMASQPTAMASRNWILRRLMLESIRQDPEYANGNYTTQPHSVRLASAFFAFATSGAPSIIRSKRRRARRPTSSWIHASLRR
jgi:homoserine acetyltransferase